MPQGQGYHPPAPAPRQRYPARKRIHGSVGSYIQTPDARLIRVGAPQVSDQKELFRSAHRLRPIGKEFLTRGLLSGIGMMGRHEDAMRENRVPQPRLMLVEPRGPRGRAFPHKQGMYPAHAFYHPQVWRALAYGERPKGGMAYPDPERPQEGMMDYPYPEPDEGRKYYMQPGEITPPKPQMDSPIPGKNAEEQSLLNSYWKLRHQPERMSPMETKRLQAAQLSGRLKKLVNRPVNRSLLQAEMATR